MAPSTITEDYYMLLEVEPNETTEQITRSYKRLALKLHPDRCAKGGSTQAFQLLQQAYETLRDESKRREYDLIYAGIAHNHAKPQSTHIPSQAPTAASASHPQSQADLELAEEIKALREQKQEECAQWNVRRIAIESSISDLQRSKRQLKREIKDLADLAAAEARKNSWASWFWSAFSKRESVSEEEAASMEQERQEREVEKDMKERRLRLHQGDLLNRQKQLEQAKKEIDAAHVRCEQAIQLIVTKKQARESQERRQRVERERIAEMNRRDQEERDRVFQAMADAYERQQAEAARAAQEEERRRSRRNGWSFESDFGSDNANMRQDSARAACSHRGWWDEVPLHAACPRCYEVWTYLLQCPGCATMACPRCQSWMRPRGGPRYQARPAPTRPRSPSPVGFGFYDDY